MDEISTKLAQIILEKNYLTPDKLREIQDYAQVANVSLEEALLEKSEIDEDILSKTIASLHGWQYVNLGKETLDARFLKLVPESVAEKQKIIPFASGNDGRAVKVAMRNPDDVPLIHLLHKRLGQPLIPYFASPKAIIRSLKLYQKEIGTEFSNLVSAHSNEVTFGDAKDSAGVKIVEFLLRHGYESKASDIHIEPQQNETAVRFRIDGVLHDIVTIPKNIHDLIITRIKILAKLRTDEHQTPQDGKLQYDFEGEPVDIRVSVLPTTKGENIVMRLLSERSRQFSLEQLGFLEADLKKIKEHIKKPWGMILSTGPTGSGKTTTLYAVLKILNKREVNITTIEDPVEYNIEGVTQIQINPRAKLTFASGLRSIVRQDPNVIMVGEIRDEETASIAINSGMTGHLVLSTIHTSDAATTLPRLLDMKIEPFLVASTVNVAIGQRLVRKICPKCIQPYEVDPESIRDSVPPEILNKLLNGKNKIQAFKGKGCEICQNTGFFGRSGVFEVLEMTDNIRELIIKRADADAIRAKAIENGMTTMFDDAIEKVSKGTTTVGEMLRAIKN